MSADRVFRDPDAGHGFFAAVLERRILDRADAGRVVSFDAVEAEEWFRNEPVDNAAPEDRFDREWALTVLERAMERVESAFRRRGKGAEFEALRPFLTRSGEQAAYDAAGRDVGLGVGAFKVALHRLRERFREALRDEVRETGSTEADVDDELRHLLRVLGR